jgi:hypothetical protein
LSEKFAERNRRAKAAHQSLMYETMKEIVENFETHLFQSSGGLFYLQNLNYNLLWQQRRWWTIPQHFHLTPLNDVYPACAHRYIYMHTRLFICLSGCFCLWFAEQQRRKLCVTCTHTNKLTHDWTSKEFEIRHFASACWTRRLNLRNVVIMNMTSNNNARESSEERLSLMFSPIYSRGYIQLPLPLSLVYFC